MNDLVKPCTTKLICGERVIAKHKGTFEIEYQINSIIILNEVAYFVQKVIYDLDKLETLIIVSETFLT